MKDSFLVVYRVDTHPGRHNKSPLEEHCLLQGASEAGLLVAEALAGSAVLPGAVDPVPPVEVLVVERVLVLVPPQEAHDAEGPGGRQRGPERGGDGGEEEEEGDGDGGDGGDEVEEREPGPGLGLVGLVDRHGSCRAGGGDDGDGDDGDMEMAIKKGSRRALLFYPQAR